MEHFYQNIDGWFSYENLYRQAVKDAPDNARFVEIGSFKGRSSAFLAVEIINSGKNIKVDFIDTWMGSIEHQEGGECEIKEVVEGTLYQTFLRNMSPVKYHYHHLRMDSVEAASLYEDNSIDFIMIDGAHEAEAVTQDITAWLPKMKKGGIMTGDDAWPGSGPWTAAQPLLSKYNVQLVHPHFIARIG